MFMSSWPTAEIVLFFNNNLVWPWIKQHPFTSTAVAMEEKVSRRHVVRACCNKMLHHSSHIMYRNKLNVGVKVRLVTKLGQFTPPVIHIYSNFGLLVFIRLITYLRKWAFLCDHTLIISHCKHAHLHVKLDEWIQKVVNFILIYAHLTRYFQVAHPPADDSFRVGSNPIQCPPRPKYLHLLHNCIPQEFTAVLLWDTTLQCTARCPKRACRNVQVPLWARCISGFLFRD